MCLLNNDGNRVIEGSLHPLLVNLTMPLPKGRAGEMRISRLARGKFPPERPCPTHVRRNEGPLASTLMVCLLHPLSTRYEATVWRLTGVIREGRCMRVVQDVRNTPRPGACQLGAEEQILRTRSIGSA